MDFFPVLHVRDNKYKYKYKQQMNELWLFQTHLVFQWPPWIATFSQFQVYLSETK